MVSLIFKGPNLVSAWYFYCMTPPQPQLAGSQVLAYYPNPEYDPDLAQENQWKFGLLLNPKKKPVELPLASQQNGIVVWSHVF